MKSDFSGDLLLFRPFMYGNAQGQSDQPGRSKLADQFAFWHVASAAKWLVMEFFKLFKDYRI
jgi:hypothetical protein